MSKVIYKYQIKKGVERVKMPIDAEILTVQLQNEIICIWAIVETENELENCYFEVAGTGEPMLQEAKQYIGTVQLKHDAYVFHIFKLL